MTTTAKVDEMMAEDCLAQTCNNNNNNKVWVIANSAQTEISTLNLLYCEIEEKPWVYIIPCGEQLILYIHNDVRNLEHSITFYARFADYMHTPQHKGESRGRGFRVGPPSGASLWPIRCGSYTSDRERSDISIGWKASAHGSRSQGLCKFDNLISVSVELYHYHSWQPVSHLNWKKCFFDWGRCFSGNRLPLQLNHHVQHHRCTLQVQIQPWYSSVPVLSQGLKKGIKTDLLWWRIWFLKAYGLLWDTIFCSVPGTPKCTGGVAFVYFSRNRTINVLKYFFLSWEIIFY